MLAPGPALPQAFGMSGHDVLLTPYSGLIPGAGSGLVFPGPGGVLLAYTRLPLKQSEMPVLDKVRELHLQAAAPFIHSP